LGVIGLGEKAGWWHQVIRAQLYFLSLLVLDAGLCAFVFLITTAIVYA
jgi:hypothetical protein